MVKFEGNFRMVEHIVEKETGSKNVFLSPLTLSFNPWEHFTHVQNTYSFANDKKCRLIHVNN